MVINIVAGGPLEYLPDLETYHSDQTTWVGVDRGVFTLLSRGIKPSYAFGDFDSVIKEELMVVEKEVQNLRKFIPEKDETDLELALNWALEQHPFEIRIFGGTGGRLDHFFANVQLLFKGLTTNSECPISIIDNKNIIFLKLPGAHTLPKLHDKKYISFLPFTSTIEKITLKGFKYPLIDRNISVGSTLCISNELIADYGTYSFSNGILIVIRSQD
ncbi:thiamine diphosphokinase [Bacillus sp. CGMCC 1.16607]|uniref:thiamine diphosphokinase n=1 Tax=Bacillus sp. CGMCC 1.16607 TaxID=3351842 RepID=UPI003627EC6E